MNNYRLTFKNSQEQTKTIVLEKMQNENEAWDYATMFLNCVEWGTIEEVVLNDRTKAWEAKPKADSTVQPLIFTGDYWKSIIRK